MATVWVPPGRVERPHPLTPLVRGWVVLVAIAVALGPDLIPQRDHSEGMPLWVVGVALLVAALFAVIAGFLSWRFTRFVIDDREVRIETGWLNTSSKKVPFERVQSIDITQPFVARLFGLAQLTIAAGGSDADLQLRYLSRRRAHQLRDHLLARSQGGDAVPARPGTPPRPGGPADDVVVRLRPRELVLGFVTSSDFIVSMLALVIVVITTGVLAVRQGPGILVASLPFVVPAIATVGNFAVKYVITQVNYSMVRTGSGHGGVRVTSGLTSLTSRTIPLDRVQGLKIHQGLLWRWLGLYRIDVDVIGTRATSSEERGPGHTLLPIGTGEQVGAVVAAVLPGIDVHPELLLSPRRCRWLRPFDHWTLQHGLNADVVVTRTGWWHRVHMIVPHAKTQSIRIRQGPMQRQLSLATVHIDNVDGPVNIAIRHVDPERGRWLAMAQPERARVARIRESRRHREPAR